jgi:hypothetical protein
MVMPEERQSQIDRTTSLLAKTIPKIKLWADAHFGDVLCSFVAHEHVPDDPAVALAVDERMLDPMPSKGTI